MGCLITLLGCMLLGDTVTYPLAECVQHSVTLYARELGEEASIQSLHLAQPDRLLEGETCRALPLSVAHLGGQQTIVVEVVKQGLVKRRVPVSCYVRTFAEALVAGRRLDRHETLDTAAVVMRRVETTHIKGRWFTSTTGLCGLRTRGMINEGSVLLREACEEHPLLAEGATVVLVTRSHGVRLSLPALALEDGRLGETITVRPIGSSQKIRSRVVDARTVEVQVE